MVDTSLPMALAKVVIAAAWADGEVDQSEMQAMRDIIFLLPKLTANQRGELDIYLNAPVDKAERDRLVDDMRTHIKTRGDRDYVKSALENMLAHSTSDDPEQEKVIQSIMAEVKNTANIFSLLGNIITAEIKKQSRAKAPNREELLDEFLNNRVYYEIRRRLELGKQDVHLSDEEMHKLGYIGALLGWVSLIDYKVSDGELKVMLKTIMRTWALNENQASFVVTVATSEKGQSYDLVRTARSLFELCSYEELLGLLEVMFEIATADGHVSDDEINKIHSLARTLLITHQDYGNIRKRYLSER